ncbi:hypothetical protein [Spongiimicrobium sp. 3-5]|uniref:hypothetical protein n=1 Tax=Spongiimicrobium sp. 3-5 TaxID=3332596 RepID=UPI00397FC0E0
MKNTVGMSSIFLFPTYQLLGNSPVAILKGLDPEMVQEFVRIAHSDFSVVKTMLEKTPTLLNASWDWGNGDFETAMGAAAHMGLHEVVSYLMSKGCALDIFALSFLGKTTLVINLIEAYPQLLNAVGPHGLTLLHHTKKGGDNAKDLHAYLLEKGLTQTILKNRFKEI